MFLSPFIFKSHHLSGHVSVMVLTFSTLIIPFIWEEQIVFLTIISFSRMAITHVGPIDYLEWKKNRTLCSSASEWLGSSKWTPRCFRYLHARNMGALWAAELFASAGFRVVCSLEEGTVPQSLLPWLTILCPYSSHITWLEPSNKENKEQQCWSHTLPCTVLSVANFMQTDFLYLLTNWETQQNLDSCFPH